MSNVYHVKQIRNGKVLQEGTYKNLITEEGIQAIAERGFDQAAALNWYMSLIEVPITAANSDTAASHPGWDEWTHYQDTTRPEWIADTYTSLPAVVADLDVDGPELTFEMSIGGSIRGIFLISDNTKGGSAGKILSIVDFGTTFNLAQGDQLNVTFTFGFSF